MKKIAVLTDIHGNSPALMAVFQDIALKNVDPSIILINHYWTEEGRFPFFIIESGKLAGFVLVREIADGQSPKVSVAEFFILRKYRGQGLGKEVAHKVSTMTRLPARLAASLR